MREKKQDKGKPIFGLAKLPEKLLLKFSRREVGELQSQVAELEYENQKLRDVNQHINNSRVELVQEVEDLRERVKQYEAAIITIKASLAGITEIK